ncbi:MAG: phosphoribosylformylglycinamidine cyclo-ligase [Woeseia sp.]
MSTTPLTYKDAGVDIDAGNSLVRRIKPLVARTSREEVLAGLGGFGGLFAIPPDRYREPVLVSGTDGVGTKLRLARQLGRHDTIGIDLVAMCANDVLVHGAEPLFFLDYFACGRLDIDVAADVVAGIAAGCTQAGAALIGGETAEMPGMYPDGEYDLAGFCVGAVDRKDLIDGRAVAPGDAIIGIASSGPHSNGYSLIRRVLEIDDQTRFGGVPVAECLLEPTKMYVRPVRALMHEITVKGIAHITGGGLCDNLPRAFAPDLHARIDSDSWQQGPVFDWLALTGRITADEMRRTFNCGVGMTLVVDPVNVERAISSLEASGETAWLMGEVLRGHGEVEFR